MAVRERVKIEQKSYDKGSTFTDKEIFVMGWKLVQISTDGDIASVSYKVLTLDGELTSKIEASLSPHIIGPISRIKLTNNKAESGKKIFVTCYMGPDELITSIPYNLPIINIRGWDGAAWQNLRSDANMHLDVNIGGLASLAHGQVTIGSTATMIKAANTSRKAITIKNIGAVDVYIGNSGVTTSNGYKLASNAVSPEIRSTAAIYGIRAADGAGTVCYWEE